MKSLPPRKLQGAIFILVSLINLAVNLIWVYQEDQHGPHGHMVMRGGWAGFWTTSNIFGALLVAGIYLFLTPEPVFPHQNKQALTEKEKKDISGLSRRVMIWGGLLFASYVLVPFLDPEGRGSWVYTVVWTGGILGLIYKVCTPRCPNCGFKIIYNKHPGLGHPPFCSGCGISFR